jgi:putative cardiolipin synthase
MKQLQLFIILLFISSCATKSKATHGYHLSSKTDSTLKQTVQPYLTKHPGKSGYIALSNGLDAFDARMALIQKAEKSLDLQYYIWEADHSGKLMMNSVIEAVKRGVKVRMLLDNLNESKFQKLFSVMENQSDLIQIRIINPHLKYFNHRMHNKSFIVDNQLAIVGGRNIGDEYFQESEHLNYFDYDLLMAGPIVDEVSKEFDVYWNSERSFPIKEIYGHTISKKDVEEVQSKKSELDKKSWSKKIESKISQSNWGKVTLVYDPPNKLKGEKDGHLNTQIRPDFVKTKKELILVSPYFIPSRQAMKSFKKLRKDGVRIVIITNSMDATDVPSVFASYRNFRKDLLKLGIELYEVRATRSAGSSKLHLGSSGSLGLHGKVMISDRELMFTGSMNLDPRSRDLNSEMGVMLHDPKFSASTAEMLLKNMPPLCYRLQLKGDDIQWLEDDKVHKKEPGETWWKSTKAWFSSLLIPKSVL